MQQHTLEVPPEALRRVCDPAELIFETTEEIAPVVGTVGQDRALSSLEFGLGVSTNGYNLYVAGVPGTGRTGTVHSLVERAAKTQATPGDWCYVYNFRDPYRPSALGLPAGTGVKLAKDMDDLIEGCKREISRVFQSETYQQRRQQLITELERRRDQLYRELDENARQRGLTVQFSPAGILTVPLVEGKPINPDEFQALPEAAREKYRSEGEALQERLVTFLNSIREVEQTTASRLTELDRQSALYAVGHQIQSLTEQYKDYPQVVSYLQAAQEDIVNNLQNFRSNGEAAHPEGLPARFFGRAEDPFARYKVNVLVNNQGLEGAPVVVEHNPTYYNLVGRVDYLPSLGTMQTDFRTIKSGALHRANGGYLVVQVRDVLLNPLAWDALKRALDCREVALESMGEMLSLVPTVSLRPDPIPLQVKVVLIGNPMLYSILYHQDEDFRKQFKVKADFDIEIDRTAENVGIYAGFIRAQVERDGLLHFHRSGVAKVVEYGSRLLEHQERLSTRFLEISDIVAEASYWAQKSGSRIVHADHVQQAIDEKDFRSSLVRDKVQRVIQENVIKITTEGVAPGQINGLSVLDMGDYVFGAPSRITARVSLGSEGVVDVERETEMSGKIHSKGVMILSGYLAGKYAQESPLSLSASLTFEQLYNEVDGDSASSTELYCLLSALGDIPLRQDLAVTGSVNQQGEIQAVGGVQYKIEGFFAVCKAKGLTGTQGVMIPRANLQHLMLQENVVEAVRQGQFHIYAVDTVDEGIELLTGLPAGELQADGTYPEGTVSYRVTQKLERYAEKLQEFGKGHRDDGPGSD